MAPDASWYPAPSEHLGEGAEIVAKRLEESERLRERLEDTHAKLFHRLAISEWKLASLRQRRLVRFGTILEEARKRPSTIPLLPIRLWRVLISRPEQLPRPVGPGDQGGIPRGDGAEPLEEVAVPARDTTALAMFQDDLREAMAHEIRIVALVEERWRSQLAQDTPSLVILDSESVVSMSEDELRKMLLAVRRTEVRSVLWDDNPDTVPMSARLLFDVVCGDAKPLPGGYEGKLVERRGWVQPRIHNPIGGHRRPIDSAMVDPASRTLAGTKYVTTTALTREAKRYKVLRASNEQSDRAVAPIIATATPLIVSDTSPGLGLHAESDAVAYALERSLQRSGVLRARLTHPAMRELMRNRSVTADVAAILGESDGARWPRIDVMVPTMRPHFVPRILDNLGRQTYPNLALYLVAHGVQVDRDAVQESADRTGVELASVVEVDDSVNLGEVFNIGFGETESGVVAKMDDDDFYGAEYLWDLYTALEFSGAEVAGKWAHYAYLEGVDSLVYRFKDFEHRFRDVVAISTLLMRREVLDVARFPAMPWGSGSVFLRKLGAEGARVFAADRWNYLYVRTTDGSSNTFPSKDLEILADSDVVCRGMNVDEVVV